MESRYPETAILGRRDDVDLQHRFNRPNLIRLTRIDAFTCVSLSRDRGWSFDRYIEGGRFRSASRVPISPAANDRNGLRGPRMTPAQRAQIVAKHEQGASTSELAK